MIAKEIGLGQATTSRYLHSLVGHDLVDKVGGARYTLGIGLYLLGQRSLNGRNVRLVAHPYLENLHRQFDETVSLALRIKDQVVVIDCIEATRALRQGSSIGFHNPWHASSLGKSMLARLPEAEAIEILSHTTLSVETTHTLRGIDAVMAALEPVRTQKYALDDEESSEGGRCVGAAILDADGRPIGAISISGPASRMQCPQSGAPFRTRLEMFPRRSASPESTEINKITHLPKPGSRMQLHDIRVHGGPNGRILEYVFSPMVEVASKAFKER